ncbi:C-GCAxxG-C-C family protein [Oleispirillum naphthae]|uniref:C-GCAxxG-C-C family protein n=1 Tax=Oleispirillum naphthae TaxID=2838853 RepID=UPI00308251AC
MSKQTDTALATFTGGYNCAQAAVSAFCAEHGLDEDLAMRLACGFGGGMGRKQEVCGAVSGAILALGLVHGRGKGGDKAMTQATYDKVYALMSAFEARHGSCLCRELLQGCDVTTPEGTRQVKERGLRDSVCMACVRSAVEIAADLI